MRAARRGHDRRPDAGVDQNPIDLERSAAFQDLPSFLHAGMGVAHGSMTGPSPSDVHPEQFRRLDEELDLLTGAFVLDHGMSLAEPSAFTASSSTYRRSARIAVSARYSARHAGSSLKYSLDDASSP